MDGPFYLCQLTPPEPTISTPAFDLREDLHYKYAPTGMHVRQYDGSLSFSVPPVIGSSCALLRCFSLSLSLSLSVCLSIASFVTRNDTDIHRKHCRQSSLARNQFAVARWLRERLIISFLPPCRFSLSLSLFSFSLFPLFFSLSSYAGIR